MKKLIYNRPKGISLNEIKQLTEYLKQSDPNFGRKYKVVYSYHCQGDFCKRYIEIKYLD